MKSSCFLLMMAALVLGAPMAAEAQALTGGPEILVSSAGFHSDGETPRIAVGPDGGVLHAWYHNPAGTMASRADTEAF